MLLASVPSELESIINWKMNKRAFQEGKMFSLFSGFVRVSFQVRLMVVLSCCWSDQLKSAIGSDGQMVRPIISQVFFDSFWATSVMVLCNKPPEKVEVWSPGAHMQEPPQEYSSTGDWYHWFKLSLQSETNTMIWSCYSKCLADRFVRKGSAPWGSSRFFLIPTLTNTYMIIKPSIARTNWQETAFLEGLGWRAVNLSFKESFILWLQD